MKAQELRKKFNEECKENNIKASLDGEDYIEWLQNKLAESQNIGVKSDKEIELLIDGISDLACKHSFEGMCVDLFESNLKDLLSKPPTTNIEQKK